MLLLVVAGVALGVGATAVAGYRWFVDRAGPPGGAPIAVNWPSELTVDEAASLLEDLGLTDERGAMELYLRVTSAMSCIESGPHLLPSGATPRELVAVLCRDKDRTRVNVTLPEGYNRFAMAARLEKKGIVGKEAFLHASSDGELLYSLGIEPAALPAAATAEGFLFPATYPLPINATPRAVVKRLVGESDRRWRILTEKHQGGWERLQAERKMDRRAVITLASMVEKEAAVADERATIASVFLNRLRDPAFPHLQSDPTSMYGCYAMPSAIPACKDFDGKASRALNRDPKNLYSTYVSEDLPPGPIANPGAASIEAVLAPANTDYLFFVAKGGGRHTFTSTLTAHNEAVEKWRRLVEASRDE